MTCGSTPNLLIPFQYSQHPTSNRLPLIFQSQSYPAMLLHSFTIPPFLLHSFARCVMLVLCASPTALSAGQKCNATRLTWESQQSTVVAGETRLDAALLSFSEKQTSTVENLKAVRELRSAHAAYTGHRFQPMAERTTPFFHCFDPFAIALNPLPKD